MFNYLLRYADIKYYIYIEREEIDILIFFFFNELTVKKKNYKQMIKRGN